MNDAIAHALFFVRQGRYRQAESHLRKAIQNDPHDPEAFFFLATCLMHDPNTRSEALSMIDQALRLRPNRAFYHAQRANILLLLSRTKAALLEIERARSLAPDSPDSYVAESVLMLVLGKPQEAERAARQALALDAGNEAAGDSLADALRIQGKLEESAAQIHALLGRNPENPWTHSSAGMLALQRGEVRDAESHFLSALRIEPEHREAREGLLHAFRARSPLYRAYLRYSFMMEKLGRTGRGMLVIGLLILMQIANMIFVGRLAPIGIVLIACYCLFVLWIWVSKGLGNLFLLFDRIARRALRTDEKREALVVGGGVLAGLASFAAGLLLKQISLIFLGLTLIAAAFPMSLVFTNQSRVGQIVFGLVGGLVYLGGLFSLLLIFLPSGRTGEVATTLFGWTMILALVTTWLGNLPILRR
ncbi:MAG: tetratricopeptide repeat protein [Verrucomicrobia bacterium]|nr:tetratricopeptide repeat protein [Verrucomicrobiota bacterium]MBV8378523.1 tetratricopeptide repeat protein [Verrucomicrobiota bacterium]